MTLSDQHISSAKSLFKKFDSDKSGKISTKELGKLMRILGAAPTQKDIKTMLSAFDKDGDGELGEDEFLKMIETKSDLFLPGVNTNCLMDSFSLFDTNQDGTLDLAELRAALTGSGEALSEEEMEQLFAALDSDGNGAISLPELSAKILGDEYIPESELNLGPDTCLSFADSITGTPEAKALFKKGLGYMFNYNHEMAIGTFTAALEADPECAMASWGIAYCYSSNYNWPPGLGSGYDSIQAALKCKDGLTTLEQDLIDALATRHSAEAKAGADPTKLMMGNDPALNVKFAEAMEAVYAKYPDNLDVAAIYAEGLMNLKPWALWTGHAEGRDAIKPADENTLKAIGVIEDAFNLDNGKQHPALCHLYCHALELSPYPEKALAAADTLRTLMPDCGHLVHMPSHIDAWVGQWKEGVECNKDGVRADDKFVELNPNMESCFYKFYRMHNIHFVVWCAMHTGQEQVALEYARKAEAALPVGDENHGIKFMLAGLIPMGFVFLESYRTMIWHVLIRFGRWDEILARSTEEILAKKDIFPSTIATAHYARGLAFATKGQVEAAEEEQTKFLEALKNPAIEGRVLHNNLMYAEEGPCILNVNKAMLEGEILYRKAALAGPSADFEEAFTALKKAVELSMNLKYNEPWGQMQPVRHALGALLLEQNRVEEATQVYRDDLNMWRDNMWGLLGLKQSLEAKKTAISADGGDTASLESELADVTEKFQKASSAADKVPTATCFCAAKAGACCASK